MEAPSLDRRNTSRIRVAHPVHISLADRFLAPEEKLSANGLLLDLSDVGLNFVCPAELMPSVPVEIGVLQPTNPKEPMRESYSLQATVVWHDPKTNRYGARLLSTAGREQDLKEGLTHITKAFVFERTAFLPDTNAEGNVYFARFFDWQGETREAYLQQGISPEEYRALLVSKTMMVTMKATMEYLKMLRLFDTIYVRMTTRNIRRASLELVFAFFNGRMGELVGRGSQQLTFQDRKGRIIPVPPPIRRIALAIEETSLNPVEALRQAAS